MSRVIVQDQVVAGIEDDFENARDFQVDEVQTVPVDTAACVVQDNHGSGSGSGSAAATVVDVNVGVLTGRNVLACTVAGKVGFAVSLAAHVGYWSG